MVAPSFKLLLPRLGLAIATTSYFKAAERTLVSTTSTRGSDSNRAFESVTSRAAQGNLMPLWLIAHCSKNLDFRNRRGSGCFGNQRLQAQRSGSLPFGE